MSVRTLWRSRPPTQTEEEATSGLRAGAVGVLDTPGCFPRKRKEH
jgi:hypothetical protein